MTELDASTRSSPNPATTDWVPIGGGATGPPGPTGATGPAGPPGSGGMVPAGKRAQGGSTVITTDSTGKATITFPVAFSGNPDTVVAINGDYTAAAFICDMSGTGSTTGFVIRIVGIVGGAWTVLTNSTVRVNWFAIGNA
jgi:hypothetical protein